MSILDIDVSGDAERSFRALPQILARAVGAQGGGGAQLAVYHCGRKVVDLVAGDFRPDSVMLVFSVSKAVAALATHHAIDRGLLSPDLALHDVWPAFGRSQRARAITLDHVLTHSSGLPSVERELSIPDHVAGGLTEAIEEQEPYWEPGTEHGYHAFTFGALLAGVFEHALGVSLTDYIDTNLARPLGLDLSLGLRDRQRLRLRLYRRPSQAVTPLDRVAGSLPDALPDGAGALVWADMLQFNEDDVLRAEWPSTNVISNASDLARLFAASVEPVEGIRVLSAEGLQRMAGLRYRGMDRMLRFPISFGSGVQLPFPQLPFLGAGSFGHEGAGGAVLAVDPRRRLSVAFVTDVFPPSNGAAPAAYPVLAAISQISDELVTEYGPCGADEWPT